MKGKLKLIILSMLALLLVACGSATPSPGGGAGSGITPKPGGGAGSGITPKPGGGTGTGGGTTPKEPVISKEWQDIKNEIVTEAKKGAKKVSLSEKNYEGKHIKGLYIKPKTIVKYDEGKVKDIVKKIGIDTTKMKLDIDYNAHLEFEGNVGEIKFQMVHNCGNMYFVDNLDKPKEYVVTIVKDKPNNESDAFINNENIYVMDGNYGSILKIEGDYIYNSWDKGNIYLGLYVSEDGKKFSTDKVHITGYAKGKTKVNFIYNAEQVNNLDKNAEYSGKDYVIKVGGVVSQGKDTFEMEKSIPAGLDLYELKFEHEGGAPKTEGHIWKLKLEKIK